MQLDTERVDGGEKGYEFYTTDSRCSFFFLLKGLQTPATAAVDEKARFYWSSYVLIIVERELTVPGIQSKHLKKILAY